MLSLNSFVVLNIDDKENLDEAANLALRLDRLNFFVYSKRYLLIGKVLLRGKGKAAVVDNDEEDVEDIGGIGGTPNSSTTNLDSEIPFEDALGIDATYYCINVDQERQCTTACRRFFFNY